MTDSNDASDGSEYEYELTAGREAVAGLMEGVVDGVLAGSIQLGTESDAISVTFPEEISFEIEYEDDGDESSLELELEWPSGGPSTESTSHESTSNDSTPHESTTNDSTTQDNTRDDSTTQDNTRDESSVEDQSESVAEIPAVASAVDGSESLARFEVFRDRGDEWRWRLRHRNGNIIAVSGEGYTRKHNAQKGLRSVVENSPEAEVTDSTTD